MFNLQLIFNLSLLIAISAISGFFGKIPAEKRWLQSVLNGLLFGVAAVAGMLNPAQFSEGVFFDGRSVLISVGTLFFGPLTGFISIVLPLALRVYLGGSGAFMGSAVIIFSFFIGWVWNNRFMKHGNGYITLLQIYIMSLLVHAVMVLLIYLIPKDLWFITLKRTGIPVMFFYPLASLLMGYIIRNQELNRKLIADLRQSEKHFRTIFHSIGDAVLTTDHFGRVKRVNPEAEKLLGMSAHAMRGKPIEVVMQLHDNLDGKVVKHPVYRILDGEIFDEQTTFLMKQPSGIMLPVCINISDIHEIKGSKTGIAVVVRNRQPELERQGALLKSAESYRNFFNNFGGLAFVQDVDGHFIDVNERACRVYGYPKSFFIGKTQEVLSAPGMNNNEEIKQFIQDAFNGFPSVFEFFGKKSDGAIFPKEMHLISTIYNNQPAVLAIGYDISQRKNAENNLRLVSERYQALFEASPVGMALKTTEEVFIHVNQAMCRDLGYTADELIGQHVSIFRLEKEYSDPQAIHKSANNKIHSRNSLVRTKTGETLIFNVRETVVDLPQNQKALLVIANNVSAQIEAENAVLQSEERNKIILSAIPDLFLRIARDGNVIDHLVNDFNKIGIIPEDLEGKSIFDLVSPELHIPFRENIDAVLFTGQSINREFKFEMDDKVYWFDARIVRSGNDEVLAFVRDVTSRKESESEIKKQKRFIETLIESIPNPLFYMDNKGVFLGINKAFRTLYQVNPDDLIGKDVYSLENEMNARMYQESDQRIFSGEDHFQSLERTIILPDGRKLECIITKSPFPGYDNEIAGLIGIITDITPQKQLEEQFKKAKEQAEQSDKLKTSFLNNMNHEIRTPLNAIMGFSELLFDDFSDEEKRSFVDTINNNAEQLLHIIDEVLLISRLDTENLPLEVEKTDISDLLNELYMSHSIICRHKNLELIKELPEKPLTVMMDKRKVRQVLTGLIENAIKYTFEGSISIGAKITDNRLRFYVRDTGIGVPLSEQEFIFQRFYRGQEGQKMAVRGNGLGLSIAARIVEVMGGTIGLISEPGKGSEFFVILAVDHSHPEPVKTTPADWMTADFSDYSILVVDDEYDNALYLSSLFEKRFATVGMARNAAEAIEMQRKHRFDIVMMDAKMPGMNGDIATRQILAEFPKTIVIGQTAYSQPEELALMLNAGAKACLVKPLSGEQVLGKIYEILHSPDNESLFE